MRKKQKLLPKFSNFIIIILFAKIVAVLGQTTCNNGLGRILYERLPNQQLQGFDDDVVRDTAPPFRVLEKCQDLCLRDRTASNNLVRACTSFDFQPGSRIASFSGSAEYEESTCYLTREQPSPEGIGILMLVPNSVHFTEICLTSQRPERECPSRRYVFERHPRKKLKLPVSDIKEITAANRSDCEDKCLNEFSFVCRSANFNTNLRSCALSRFTRRTHPDLLEDDPSVDYLENTCLNAERRCDGLAVYVKEENKRLGGPFEVDIFNNMTLEECQTMCLRAEKYFCRSVEFDDQTKQCILSEEDSISQKDDISISSSPTHHFYDLVCLDNQRGTEYPDNSVTSHLFSSGRRPDTAFQRYRNSRLGGEFHSEITGRSLSECLDECLRQTSFQCRSAVYSDRFHTCRLSRYNQRDGMRIIYDADYDYYENLMLGGDGDDRDRPNARPDMGNGIDWRPPYPGDSDRDRNKDRLPADGGDRYPNNRYPPSDGKYPYDKYSPTSDSNFNNNNNNIGDRYPDGGDNRFPMDRYPMDRYPMDRNPMDRFPSDKYNPMDRFPSDKYPPMDRLPMDRYPMDRFPMDRYPMDKYPTDNRIPMDRYPMNKYPEEEIYMGRPNGRYPDSRYPDNRYPDGRYPDDRMPDGRYPANTMPGGRYPDDRYPDNRYPDARYPDSRYPDNRYPPDSRMPDGRYPENRLPDSRYPDNRIPDGGRYPDYRQPGGRYPMDDRSRYPGGRYPADDRSRYPGRYPGMDRDLDRGRYPGDYMGRDQTLSGRYPDDKELYPGNRYPPDRVNEIYPDNRYPPARYPDKNIQSSISDNKNPIDRKPIDGARIPPINKYPADGRYPDQRIPTGQIPANSRYPSPENLYPNARPDYVGVGVGISTGRYPDERDQMSGGSSGGNRYPTSENRFPVGNDRNPIYIYKYGNRERFPNGSGYDRFPYIDRDRDRGYGPGYGSSYGSGYGSSYGSGYGTMYGGRDPIYPTYDRMGYDYDYDRGYDRSNYDRNYGRPQFSGGGYPQYEMPNRPLYTSNGYDNSINPINGDGYGGYGPVRPYNSRCDDSDNFKQVGVRQRVRRQYVRRILLAPSLMHCQRECVEAKEFICRSFNYRDSALSYDIGDQSRDRENGNCELSDRDSRELDLQNPAIFDTGSYDYYERSNSRNGIDGDCLDVSQTCNEEGIEFTLRTPEGFLGRIYTYGSYDRCFFRGNGGTVNVLRISGVQGYPECGTQRYGDIMTNIVVVQFSDNVQTGRDKRFNLTCIFRGPGEAIVTSGYIGAGSGSPIPIEYLPAENTLSSKVRLMILYQNRPTTTIAVGDPLTFRLEAQEGYNHVTDIFATNVVARDPYSGRSIQLIDRYGCPVDPYVFPELDKLRSGDMLEARFNAFKIPESNFLVFEATVRSCREGCQPAYCPGISGRSEPSFGRRKRSLNDTSDVIDVTDGNLTDSVNATQLFDEINAINSTGNENIRKNSYEIDQDINEYPEHVREMIEVFESREEIENEFIPRKLVSPVETVCLTPTEYHGLISACILLMILLLTITLAAGFAYRRYWTVMMKNRAVDRSSPIHSFAPTMLHQNIQHSSRNSSNLGQQQGQRSSGLNFFNGGLHKTFATGNLSRMCQMPVINPISRTNGNATEFDDPSEPIYTDPSLFERSRSLRSISVERSNEV